MDLNRTQDLLPLWHSPHILEPQSARLLLDLDRAAKDYGLRGKSITYFDRLEDIRNNVERQLEELWEIESS